MEFPLYRPVPHTVSRRRPLPFLSLGGVVVGAALLVLGVVPLAQLPRSTLAAALAGYLCLGAGLGWIESRLLTVLRRVRAERISAREREAFESDLRRALDGERRELLRRSREPGVLVLGAGAVDSEVRVVGDARRLVQEEVPLIVRHPGTIRVLGPPALASSVIAALARHAVSARPDEPPRWTFSAVAGDTPRFGTAPFGTAPGTVPLDCVAEIWLGPDGSAAVRARGQAGGAWVAFEPRLG